MDAEKFASEMWERLKDVAVAYGAFAKKMRVDENELYVVDALWDAPDGLSQRSICEACDLGKQTISAICKRLSARGFIIAQPSSSDKREKIMALTPEGRDAWCHSVELMRELELQAACAIAPEDADAFIRVVEQYAKTFQDEVHR